MNWQEQLENLYLSQSIIEDEIQYVQEQIYLESPEYYLQTTKEKKSLKELAGTIMSSSPSQNRIINI